MSYAATVFTGYAYFSASGDGFVYAMNNSSSTTAAPGAPVVVVSGVSKAANFFPFLFLVAGGGLSLLLFVAVLATFCCRCRVTALEETYWRLQHAFAEVSEALVHEVAAHTPAPAKRQPSMQRQPSSRSVRPAPQQPQPQPQQQQQRQSVVQRQPSTNSIRPPPPPPQQQQPQSMQRHSSTNSVRSQHQLAPPSQQPQQQQQPQQMMQSSMGTYPPTSNPWTLTSTPVGVYPPRQPVSQPLFPAAPINPNSSGSANPYDYNNMYAAQNGMTQQQQQQQGLVPVMAPAPQPILSPTSPQRPPTSPSQQPGDLARVPSASPDALRRRASKVRFVGT